MDAALVNSPQEEVVFLKPRNRIVDVACGYNTIVALTGMYISTYCCVVFVLLMVILQTGERFIQWGLVFCLQLVLVYDDLSF